MILIDILVFLGQLFYSMSWRRKSRMCFEQIERLLTNVFLSDWQPKKFSLSSSINSWPFDNESLAFFDLVLFFIGAKNENSFDERLNNR